MALSTIGTGGIADSAISTAKIAADAITSAKLDTNIAVDGSITAATSVSAGTSVSAATELIGNVSGRILLDASASGTDVGDEFLLNATDGSAANDGSKILFEEGTDDGSAALNNRLNQKFDVGSIPQGGIVQVQTRKHTSAAFTTTSNAYVDITTCAGHIKPKFADSKILVLISLPQLVNTYTRYGYFSVRRSIAGATAVDISGTTLENAGSNNADGIIRVYAAGNIEFNELSLMCVDAPGTTEELTYFPACRRGNDSATITIGDTDLTQTIIMMEIRDQESSVLTKQT